MNYCIAIYHSFSCFVSSTYLVSFQDGFSIGDGGQETVKPMGDVHAATEPSAEGALAEERSGL